VVIFLVGFIYLQIPSYSFLYGQPNNQIQYAKKVAASFIPHIKNDPIQIVALPTTETDGHFRYFLDLFGVDVLPQESPQQPEELYVLCRESCLPTDDPHWQIAFFTNKMLEAKWRVEDVTIYKIVHGKTK
jgi:hypothetical protein